MRKIKDENIRKTLIYTIATIAIFNIVFLFINIMQYTKYNKIVNYTINRIVNEVISEYPNVNDQDIINILNQSNLNMKDNNINSKEIINVLDRYGYENEMSYVTELKKEMNNSLAFNILAILMFYISVCIVFLIYNKRKNKKIEEINKYLKAINNKDYALNIEDNGEGELSRLRNELYKVTISLKEAAQNSEKEKVQLANSLADISHQLKTPLTSIRIMLDNIQDNPNMDENIRLDFINEISKQTDWISSLVISLLKLVKFDSGVIVMNKERINIKQLLDNVISNLAIILDIKNIEIICDISNDATFIADYKWEVEALTNIIKNSIEHSNDNSKIYINVEDTILFTKIIIKDNGEGIDKEDLKHIFERFYKSKNASESSMGIGLSLANSIIKQDNGYIDVESQINNGTTFRIKYIK